MSRLSQASYEDNQVDLDKIARRQSRLVSISSSEDQDDFNQRYNLYQINIQDPLQATDNNKNDKKIQQAQQVNNQLIDFDKVSDHVQGNHQQQFFTANQQLLDFSQDNSNKAQQNMMAATDGAFLFQYDKISNDNNNNNFGEIFETNPLNPFKTMNQQREKQPPMAPLAIHQLIFKQQPQKMQQNIVNNSQKMMMGINNNNNNNNQVISQQFIFQQELNKFNNKEVEDVQISNQQPYIQPQIDLNNQPINKSTVNIAAQKDAPAPPLQLHQQFILEQNKQEDKRPLNQQNIKPAADLIHPPYPLPIISKQSQQFFQVDPNQLIEKQIIGQGATAQVFRGEYRGTDVAIKKLRILKMKQEAMKQFRRQVATLMRLHHPNLVIFMGACQKDKRISIVTQYCNGGTLFSLLHEKKQVQLSWSQRVKICLDVARGMQFLHTHNPPIIHRDLKSLNLLICNEIKSIHDPVQIKITDFGLSRYESIGDDKMTGQTGTFHWMAPEILRSDPYTIKADIFSFGVVMWQVMSRQTPYIGMTPAEVAYKVLHFKQRPNLEAIEKSTPEILIKLLMDCWSETPNERPTFSAIIQTLKQLTQSFS